MPGSETVFIAASVYAGSGRPTGIVAGITGMRWLRFLAFNALGAALRVGDWVSLGYLAGRVRCARRHSTAARQPRQPLVEPVHRPGVRCTGQV